MANVPLRIAGVADQSQVDTLRELLAEFEIEGMFQNREFALQLWVDEADLPKVRARVEYSTREWGPDSYIQDAHYRDSEDNLHDLWRMSERKQAIADRVAARIKRE